MGQLRLKDRQCGPYKKNLEAPFGIQPDFCQRSRDFDYIILQQELPTYTGTDGSDIGNENA